MNFGALLVIDILIVVKAEHRMLLPGDVTFTKYRTQLLLVQKKWIYAFASRKDQQDERNA